MSSWRPELGHTDEHGELVVHPILQHHAQLADQAGPREARVPARGPDEEPLEPDQECERESLRAAIQLGERQGDRQHHSGRRKEQLEVLGDLGPKGVPQLPRRNHDNLEDRWRMGEAPSNLGESTHLVQWQLLDTV